MSTNPTTKSQVQAYRFVLRRMESALVRKDAVMLHEPLRHHLRAMAAGLILAMAALAACWAVSAFSGVKPARLAPLSPLNAVVPSDGVADEGR